MSKAVKKNFNQWIYCFSTIYPIIKKFNNTNKKPDDYAVYKVGKTKRTIEERMQEHGDIVDEILFEKRVYDCDTTETDLLDLLKADKNLKKRNNLTDKTKDEKKEKGDTGLEYFEGRYIHIKPYLDMVISESFQCSKPRNMDIDNICPICDIRVATEGGLKRHMTRMHNIKSEPKTSSSRVKAPKASLSRVKAPKTSVSRVKAPKASSSRLSPPRASSSRVKSPKASSSRVSPPRASVSRVSPPRASVSRVSPPRASLPKIIPLQYQLRATKQPKYITEIKKTDLPLYSNYRTSNNLKKSNILRMIDRLNINYKKAEKRKRSNRSSLSRSPNLRSNKRAK